MALLMIAETYISRMEEYRKNGSDDEWFFAKLSDSLLENCNPSSAFDAIELVVICALEESEDDLFYYHIQFIIRLGRKSNTSESPALLKSSVAALYKKAVHLGDSHSYSVKELCAWFRLPFNKRVN